MAEAAGSVTWQAAVVANVRESVSHLARHDGSTVRPDEPWNPRDRGHTASIKCRVAAGVAHLHIWWLGVRGSRMGPDFLWDRLTLEVPADTSTEELLQVCQDYALTQQDYASDVTVVQLSASEAETPLAAPPLYQYHPQRFRSLVPFARELSRIASQAGPLGGLTRQEAAELQRVANSRLLGMVQKKEDVHKTPIRARVAEAEIEPGAGQQSMEAWSCFLWFERAGRNIFDVPSRMAQLFRRTDVDDLPASMLRLPYAALYVGFDAQEDLELRPGWHPDGAYVVQSHDGGLWIAVTARAPSVERFKQGWVTEAAYVQFLKPEYLKNTFG